MGVSMKFTDLDIYLDREPIMKYIRNWGPIRLHTDEKKVYILRSGHRMHSLFL